VKEGIFISFSLRGVSPPKKGNGMTASQELRETKVWDSGTPLADEKSGNGK
jgi:hypothetical protein